MTEEGKQILGPICIILFVCCFLISFIHCMKDGRNMLEIYIEIITSIIGIIFISNSL